MYLCLFVSFEAIMFRDCWCCCCSWIEILLMLGVKCWCLCDMPLWKFPPDSFCKAAFFDCFLLKQSISFDWLSIVSFGALAGWKRLKSTEIDRKMLTTEEGLYFRLISSRFSIGKQSLFTQNRRLSRQTNFFSQGCSKYNVI